MCTDFARQERKMWVMGLQNYDKNSEKNKNFTNNFTGDRVKMYIFCIFKINFVHFFFLCIANSRKTCKVAFRNY